MGLWRAALGGSGDKRQSNHAVMVHRSMTSLCLPLLCLLSILPEPSRAATMMSIAQWSFNSNPSDANTRTGTNIPSFGVGTAALVGAVSESFFTGSSSDPVDGGVDNSGWSISSFPPQGTGNKQAGVQFNASTSGKLNIVITWDQQVSPTASSYSRFQYSTNRRDFIDFSPAVLMSDADTFEHKTVSLSGIAGVNHNTNFAFRIVTEFQATAIGNANSNYVTASTSDYNTVGRLRFDMVTVWGEAIAAALSSASYSTNGGFQFDVTGASEASYVVEGSSNLTNWVSLGTNVAPFAFSDAGAGILPNRFYRAVYLP